MSRRFYPKPLYVLLGDPVDHSLSPAMQNAAFEALGLDAVYVALCTAEPLVAALMKSVAALGGGGNVTVPHKRAAARSLDNASESVVATGACNVFWWEGGRGLCGDNTDVEGFRCAAEALRGAPLRGCRVLLLGAGGAARAVVHACLAGGAERIDLLNRSQERAASLFREMGEPANLRLLQRDDEASTRSYELVVNATSLGLEPSDPLPLDPAEIDAAAVMDLVYSATDTPFVRACREAGLVAEDGRRMLVEQAAASLRAWFDQEPPRDVMYAAVGLRAPDLTGPG